VDIHEIVPGDKYYPAQLYGLPQPVYKLYVIGNLQILKHRSLGVVGSRAVTNYGREVTMQLITEVVWSSIPIVSGLALGVDSIAHKVALRAGGPTIAVLPGGIENIYPASHKKLAEEIVRQGGALISEYPGKLRPHKYHFIARNRIIAGLSHAVLITEAAEKSGSLHTAQFALEQGKDVLAVPGSIFNPNSVGAHNLLKQGAQLVQTSEEILNLFAIPPSLP
jgi:DNA processing protein